MAMEACLFHACSMKLFVRESWIVTKKNGMNGTIMVQSTVEFFKPYISEYIKIVCDASGKACREIFIILGELYLRFASVGACS